MQIDEIKYLVDSINHISKKVFYFDKEKFKNNILIQKIRLSYFNQLNFLKKELWLVEKKKILKKRVKRK